MCNVKGVKNNIIGYYRNQKRVPPTLFNFWFIYNQFLKV